MSRRDFALAHPGFFFLDPTDGPGLEDYLGRQGVLSPGERIGSLEHAGPGNMNCVLRVTTSIRSLIVKQARPWVERYPQFAAPRERALRERDFYHLVSGLPGVAVRMPRLLHADAEACLLVLEDLGPGSDLGGFYTGAALLDEAVLVTLADFLSDLHQGFSNSPRPPEMANRAMRILNGEHVFFLPLRPGNGLDLDRIQPGLAAATVELRSDRSLATEIERLGHERYLADGPCLVHGDFFPGSLLRTQAGTWVIDPEFAFFGRPEFDVGVFLAHLTLARLPADRCRRFLEAYRRPTDWLDSLVWQFAGVEILRRLIGYAQLPLPLSVEAKLNLLEQSRAWVLKPAARR